MIYSRIAGTGAYLPQKIMTNDDLAKSVETSHAWIVERTGIEYRHIAAPDETAASMALQATQRALAASDLPAQHIDMIIVATATPDYIFPSVACVLQHRLGVRGGAAFDIVGACTGFIYALSVADKFIQSGQAKTVLVVASEIMSRLVDWDDRQTCVLFGDGAGAVILQASDKPGIRSTHLHADGHYENLLWVPSALSTGQQLASRPFIQMQGNEVFRLAINTLSDCIFEVLSHNQITSAQIDWLIPHQANVRIIQGIAKKLSLPLEKVVLTVALHGNTSAASIPLALDTAIRDGRIQRGQTLLLEAFGAGLTWGSVLVDY